MKLRNAFSLLVDMTYAVRVALWPTLREITHAPGLLFRPVQLSRLFMSFVWTFFGNVVNENSRGVKSALITPNAYGVVLDIGAGRPDARLVYCTSASSRTLAYDEAGNRTWTHDRLS